MSKELEALEVVKQTINDMLDKGMKMDGDIAISLEQYLNIIESALKDYEKLKDEYDRLESIHTHFIEQYNLLMKDHSHVLKALGIIKRLINKSGTEYWLYKTENDYVFADFRISKEEYELLKEVLL